MLKYFKIHLAYLINKFNLIIFFAIIVLGIIINLIGFAEYNNVISLSDVYNANNNLISLNILFLKLLGIGFFVVIFGNSFTKNGNSYHYLFVDYKNNEKKYFISKILVLMFLVIISCSIIFSISSIIGINITNWYDIYNGMGTFYISSVLIILVYGIISIIMAIIIPSNLSYFISIILFVFSSVIDVTIIKGEIKNLIVLFLPVISESYINYSFYGIIHLLVVCLLYIEICYICFVRIKE